jgi:hypothetical protein
MLRSLINAVTWLMLCVSVPAHAGLVTLDFEEFSGGLINYNLESHGFRISPKCHIDFGPSPEGGVALGGDISFCTNADFLGTGIATPFGGNWVFFDFYEHPFSLESFEWFGVGTYLLSSKGGASLFSAGVTQGVNEVSLSGPEWTGVSWVMAHLDGPGAPNAFIDDMVFRAPSPGTLPLVATAIAALVLIARRSKRISRRR